MKIKSVEFFGSAVTSSQYPIDNKPEIVLSGRSNVGKSSLINSLLNRKNEARVSGNPGKTQTLNFFNINDDFYFVDVPGYGYAKVSKKIREEFGNMIEEYLVYRDNLKLVVLLVDMRHDPSEDDCLMYDYLKVYDIPVLLCATKMDKVNKTQRQKHINNIKEKIKFSSSDYFMTYSSISHETRDEVWEFISKFL